MWGELNQRAAEEIAGFADPLPALSSTARILLKRYEPIAFARFAIGQKVGVGRARAIDDADSAQKIDPAARSVMPFSGPISR